MSIIPGSIPVTGFIAPTDTSDDYAVTDAIYGIDGLRNVVDYTARNNISIERRRAGMVVGTINDGKYWRLKNQAWTLGSSGDWELFLQVGPSGSVVSTGLKYIIESTDDIEVPNYTQYWIYGDLTIYGQMTNYGEVIIADGGLVMSGGTFSNYGTLTFVTINGTASGTASYVNSATIGFTITGSTVSAQVITGSLTASHLNTGLNGGATAGYFLSADVDGNFQWIPGSGVGTITGVNAGMGLTGGGVSGTVTLDVNVDNGLSIVNDNVVLGGTLSQSTIINGDGNNFSLINANTITLTASNAISVRVFDSNLNGDNLYLLVDANQGAGLWFDGQGTYSRVIVDRDGFRLSVEMSTGTSSTIYGVTDGNELIDDGTSNNSLIINDQISQKGLVYKSDYTSNFTTHSLVTKQYVDTQIAGITGGSASSSITSAGSGLTQSGTTASRTLHLGGVLTQNAIFDGYYDVTFGNTNPLSWFFTKVGTGGTSSQIELIPGEIDIANINGSSASRIHFYSNGSALGIGDSSLNNSVVVTDETYSKGLVYANDYSANFTTFSLVTKGYVNSLITSGVTGGNGLSIFSPGVIGIGGSLVQYTNIDLNGQYFQISDSLGGSYLQWNADLDITLASNNGNLTLYSPNISQLSGNTTSVVGNNTTLTGTTTLDVISSGLTTITSIDVMGNFSGFMVSTASEVKTYASSTVSNIAMAIHNIIDNAGGVGSFPGILNRVDSNGRIWNITGLGAYGIHNRSLGIAGGVYNEVYVNGNFASASKVELTSVGSTITNNGTNNVIVLTDTINNKGAVYASDYSSNFTPESLVSKRYVDNKISASSSRPTINDKNLVSFDTTGDGVFSGATISGTPIDNSYVSVFINGVEYLVGNGVTNSVDCYFSNTGGSNARGFSSAHPNGRIQANDGLYWNGTVTGVNLISGWRISIHYLI